MTELVVIHSKDPDFYLLISHILTNSGFPTALAETVEALSEPRIAAALATIVDCSTDPGTNLLFCRAHKSNPATAHLPLLALIPARQESHLLPLLKAGIDEALIRPVSPEHVIAYLRGLCDRRHGASRARLQPSLRFDDLEIDESLRMIKSDLGSAQLSPIEFRLLKRLIEEPGRVRDRNDLIQAAWPPNFHVEHRTVDVHIAKLRRRLKQTTGKKIIRTIRSTGFVVDDAAIGFEKS
ncbi:response regulator transcription factor [Rhizobium sp. TRM96647]|uniref:winged helix-turn-helix transcriptional regulator n=1 Tax=unclassified Rhizobium TaxID=2613769 RepID=UPI0021E6FC79|nr:MULTISPECIES: response regulator transcription factor [unclassified Rhizobium]MCV3739536.1 response regulator transcription factor [Rhizobium sp. TRM96647]MCV3761222.1 response regulator transcription factor [Rhizobium sp. TRM96650]